MSDYAANAVRIASLEATVQGLTATVTAQTYLIGNLTESSGVVSTEMNTFYLMWAGALVFLMQAGFAVLSAGSIRTKNVKNILLKNLLDACMGARRVGFFW